MLRFYDIKSGAITVDGHDISAVTTESLRRQVGLVLQEPFLFSGTVRDNIRFGKLDATDDEVIAAAKAVNLHKFIESMPFGYDTEVQDAPGNSAERPRQTPKASTPQLPIFRYKRFPNRETCHRLRRH